MSPIAREPELPNVGAIKQKALDLGFHKVGVSSISDRTEAAQQLQQWLNRGHHADMAWMADPRRQDIRQAMPEVRSVISVALNYYTPHPQSQDPSKAKISRYGWGRDYHKVLGRRLKAMAVWLETRGDGIKARYYVDTGPIAEKAWAQQAGLGWIGKHGNVITREYGSWVFLGELLTNLDLPPDRPHTEHCGTCTRCMEACPTQAIAEPFVVDANRCIAYQTIENRSERIPEAIAPHLHNWVAGCDICQEVCPWNERFARETDIPDFQPYPENLAPPLVELAQLSDSDWDRRFRASALRRIRPDMMRRNAKASLPETTSQP
ncbi:tRNA epoxyqueuosine(34) reductase QueG [Altericista sp. CCNU0014]|uniref:tRNA epoxyqueuosine(34) reductase QueG n=1 Tax=Altericista sp. CCNU0014 TaxID=3082949 RepID=UPI00384F14E5